MYGEQVSRSKGSALLALCIQHETDHLDRRFASLESASTRDEKRLHERDSRGGGEWTVSASWSIKESPHPTYGVAR